MPRVPSGLVYNEQKVGLAPLPNVRIPTNSPDFAGAAADLNEKAAQFAYQGARAINIQTEAFNRAEAARLRGKTVEEFESIIQTNALEIADPDEFVTKTREALRDHKTTVTDTIENTAVRSRLDADLGAHMIAATRKVEALHFGKRRDKARANVDEASEIYGRLAINGKSADERSGALAAFGDMIGFTKGSNLISADFAADQVRNMREKVRVGRRDLFVTGLSSQLQNLVNDATTGKGAAQDLFKDGNQLIASFTDMNPAEIEKAKAVFKDSLWTGAIEGRIRRDPGGTLRELTAGSFNALVDQNSLRSLTDRAQTEVEQLQRKAEAERKEQVRQIGKAVDDYKLAAMMGFDWAGNEAQLAAAVKGTEHEAEFLNTRAASRTLGQFSQMAPVEQEQYLRIVSRGQKTGTEAKFFSTLQAAHERTKTELGKDPLTFAIRQRVIPPLMPFDLSKPNSLKERSIAAAIVSQRYGIEASPLSDEEAGALSDRLTKAPADSQVSTLQQLRRGLEDRQVKAVAAQVARKKDDPVLVQAMGLSLEAPEAAARILRGREIVRDNREIQLKGTDLKTAQDRISSTIGDAFKNSPAHYSAVSDAALSIYAFKSWQQRDLSGAYEKSRLDEAIREASGGVIQLGRLGSRYTVQAPRYGASEADFTDLLKRADYSKARGMSGAQIQQHGVFESIGDGRYLVRVGPGYVQSDQGPFVLDLGRIPPRGASGAALGGAAGLVR